MFVGLRLPMSSEFEPPRFILINSGGQLSDFCGFGLVEVDVRWLAAARSFCCFVNGNDDNRLLESLLAADAIGIISIAEFLRANKFDFNILLFEDVVPVTEEGVLTCVASCTAFPFGVIVIVKLLCNFLMGSGTETFPACLELLELEVLWLPLVILLPLLLLLTKLLLVCCCC